MEHREGITGVDVQDVRQQLVDKEFLAAFADEVGVHTNAATLTHNAGVDHAVLVWSFSMDKPGIPSLARKFLSDQVTLTWDQTWQPVSGEGCDGQLLVTLDGKPGATSHGRCQVRAQGDSAVLMTDTSTRTSLPRLVAGGIEATIDKELVGWILQVQARVLRRRLLP